MEIIKLEGTDKLLYELIAPLVMNPAIIRQNNNYPFKTSRKHTWYIATEDKQVAGFMPLKTGTATMLIDNYYINGDRNQTINRLLERIIADVSNAKSLTALVHKRHVETFNSNGFQTTKEWSKYDKMKYKPQTEDGTTT